jgi:hypothetical protein
VIGQLLQTHQAPIAGSAHSLIICCSALCSEAPEVNESADEVGGYRRLIMLIFEDRLAPPSWSRFVALGSRIETAQRNRGFSTVGRLDR